ncbi:MAG: hypothetical protein AAF658_18395 [Myxococcota bacterium]
MSVCIDQFLSHDVYRSLYVNPWWPTMSHRRSGPLVAADGSMSAPVEPAAARVNEDDSSERSG